MPLDSADFTWLAEAFDLGRPLGEPRPLANGDNPNVNQLLTTERSRWVIRHGAFHDTDYLRTQMLRTHRLESAALAAGIPMPRPVEPPEPSLGYWYSPDGEQRYRVTEWLDGHDLRSAAELHAVEADPKCRPEAARWVGETLGRIAGLGLEEGIEVDDYQPLHPIAEWEDWVAEAEADKHDVAAAARALLPVVAEATTLIADAWRDRPPSLLAHRDTSQANVLRTPTGFALIDWENAGPEVPWRETVNVAFGFSGASNGTTVEADPRLIRPLIAGYLAEGGPPGPADATAFAGMLRAQLGMTAWCLWLAMGHRNADAETRAFGRRHFLDAAQNLPRTMRSLGEWAELLR